MCRVSEKKKGFTLAEVLITLTVIGVVAALTLPTLISTMHTNAMERKEKVFKLRLVHGLREMAVKSRLTNFDSTYDFAQELGQHYKYFNLCKADNIKACYSVDKVDTGRGELDLSNITASTLNLKNDDTHEWLEPVAIVTTDGTPFIFSYNKKCTLSESDINEGVKDNGTAKILNCIAGVYDKNGVKTPNKQNKDIISFNRGTFDKHGCAIDFGDFCISAPFTPTPVTKSECESMIGTAYGIKACYHDTDYWAGAVKQCGHVDKLPTQDQLQEISDYIYKDVPQVSGEYDTAMLTERTASLGLPEITQNSSFYMWSGEEYSSDFAYRRSFYSDGSDSYAFSRYIGLFRAVCLGD